MLRLPDAWIWDFWLTDAGRFFHLYSLRAPRGDDPDARHWNVSLGHAVSADLTRWTVLADAIAPAPGPAFDDLTTWTGSVVRGPDDSWFMFYTGAAPASTAANSASGWPPPPICSTGSSTRPRPCWRGTRAGTSSIPTRAGRTRPA